VVTLVKRKTGVIADHCVVCLFVLLFSKKQDMTDEEFLVLTPPERRITLDVSAFLLISFLRSPKTCCKLICFFFFFFFFFFSIKKNLARWSTTLLGENPTPSEEFTQDVRSKFPYDSVLNQKIILWFVQRWTVRSSENDNNKGMETLWSWMSMRL